MPGGTAQRTAAGPAEGPKWAGRRSSGAPVQPAGAVVGPTFVRLKVELRGSADFSKVRREAENLKVHLALEHEPLGPELTVPEKTSLYIGEGI